MTTPTTVTLSVQLLDAVLAYLGSRPYAESARLIHSLQAEARQSIQEQQQAEQAAAQATQAVQAAKATAQDAKPS